MGQPFLDGLHGGVERERIDLRIHGGESIGWGGAVAINFRR
jgi:hypothetical protein